MTKHSSENEMMLGESECRIYPYFKIQLAAQPWWTALWLCRFSKVIKISDYMWCYFPLLSLLLPTAILPVFSLSQYKRKQNHQGLNSPNWITVTLFRKQSIAGNCIPLNKYLNISLHHISILTMIILIVICLSKNKRNTELRIQTIDVFWVSVFVLKIKLQPGWALITSQIKKIPDLLLSILPKSYEPNNSRPKLVPAEVRRSSANFSCFRTLKIPFIYVTVAS